MPAPSQDVYPAIAAEIALASTATSIACKQMVTGEEFATVEAAISSLSETWVIGVPELGERIEKFLGRDDLSVFAVDELPGQLFVTNGALSGGKSRVVLDKGTLGSPAVDTTAEPVDKAAHLVTKVIKTAEERFVLGVVLVPEVTDSQGDIYSHDEVRKAAHAYMERTSGVLGKQHGEIVTGKLKVLENYLAPADFSIGDESITAGTWLMGIRVVDDDLWTAVKAGSFTGFSIGGAAFRRPESD